MRLTVLTDNNTYIDRYFLAEPGWSVLIEDDSKRILFDCGYSSVFWKNALSLGQNLLFLDYLLFSHGHLDHTWGVERLIREFSLAAIEDKDYRRPKLIAHPLCFEPISIPGLKNIGSFITKDELNNHFELGLSASPRQLTERLFFLGQIPRKNDFENQVPIGEKHSSGQPDFQPDDTALAYKSEQGLVIITGCSHSGICNIVEYARDLCSETRVRSVIGGLHLLDPPQRQLEQTCRYFANLGLESLYAGHCTDLNSKIALSQMAPLAEVGAGLRLEF